MWDTDGKNKNRNCNNSKIISTKKLEGIVYEYLSKEIKKINDQKIIEESNKYIERKRKKRNELEMLKKEIEIKKINIKNLYLQKVSNQITIEIFCQKKNEINEQIEEREKRIEQITKNIDDEKQKQDVREQYEQFKKENNLMKYINDLVKEINFYEDRKIEIKLAFARFC